MALGSKHPALQRTNTENSKQIFAKKELRGHNFHIHVSVSDLYIIIVGLPILLQEMCGPILGICTLNRSQTHEQSCWRNEGSVDRDEEQGRGLGLDEFFFPESTRSSNSTRYFKFCKNSNSISPRSFPKIISIARSSSRNMHTPPTP